LKQRGRKQKRGHSPRQEGNEARVAPSPRADDWACLRPVKTGGMSGALSGGKAVPASAWAAPDLLPSDQSDGATMERSRTLQAERNQQLSPPALHHAGLLVHRVLIVDDHQIMLQGLVALMRSEPDIEVVGQAANGPQAIELAGRLQPDVIIMDVNLGEMSGIEATREILARTPRIKVIGLSMYADPDVAAAMRDAGAVAYLAKGGPSEELAMAIRACRQ
jgi:CheY-like chemotaxis protein